MKRLWAIMVLLVALALIVGCTSSESYELIRYSVKTSTEGQGKVTVSPNQDTFVKGEKVTFTAKPDEGWNFDHWEYGPEGSKSIQNPFTLAINSNLTIKAVFISATESFTLKVQYVGEGTVEVTPSKERYLRGEQVTLLAHPSEYWLFNHWEGAASGTENPITITMNDSKIVTAVFSYDVGRVIFSDDDLEKCIRKLISKPLEPILMRDIIGITTLNASHIPIENLGGIEYMAALTNLNLSETTLADINSLRNLTAMQVLNLGRNKITDINPLTLLVSLKELDLHENQLSNVSALIWLWKDKNFTKLDLSYNQLSTAEALAGLDNLEDLNLANNSLNDIRKLSGLVNLKVLNLSRNLIADAPDQLKSLQALKSLEKLDMSYNSLTEVDDLVWLWDGNLREINFAGNQIKDINVLNGLSKLEKVIVNDNQIDKISVFSGLPNIKELDLSNNQIVDITSVGKLKNLTYLYLHNNKIVDISALLNLIPQSGAPVLKQVTLSGNPLNVGAQAVIDQLESHGVIVIN